MTDLPVLRDLGVILLAALACALLARRARTPTIVAYLVAGLVLGPGLHLVDASEPVDLMSEVGIVLLLFLVGLELSLDKIRDVGRVVLSTAAAQVGLTAAGGFGLSLLLGFPPVEALFLAVALTFSSTVVVVKLLDQKHESDSLHGRIAVGILLVQDVVVIVALTLLGGLDPEGAGDPAAMLRGLLASLGGMGVLVAAALLAARRLLPRAMGWAARSFDVLFIWSLFWCFLFVAAAEAMHLSVEIGAFLAGISLAQLPYAHELRRRVHPLMNFFIAVFFVSLGAHMELGAALEHWGAVLAFSVFVVAGKWLVVTAALARAGQGEATAFRAGVSLAQISEFSFIFASLGLASGYVGRPVLSILGAVGLLTIGGSSYLILADRRLHALARRAGLLRPFRARPEAEDAAGSEPRGHVVVVGMNALGRRIVRGLAERGEVVVAVDSDPAKLAGLPGRQVLGNAEHPAVLEEAGLPRAKLLVSALQIEDANNLLAFRGRSAGVPTSIHAFDQAVVEELREIGADHLIVSKSAGTHRLGRILHRLGVTPG
ncbi:MAG TPA: cation:proton antiporter [Longimicrobiaceae bacterium]|nr:cation:proton antiporter [Longimicrobiaceae bacterium]